MIKKILFTFMGLTVAMSTILAFYSYFKPEKVEAIASTTRTTPMIPYETTADYLLSSGDSTIHYLFFCSATNPDCRYIEDTVMKSLESEQGHNLFEHIEYVDISSLEASLSTNQLKDDWGINTYPAFVSVSVNDGSFSVNNFIQWDKDNPTGTRDLKQWMVNNGIWAGLFEAKDEEIILPK